MGSSYGGVAHLSQQKLAKTVSEAAGGVLKTLTTLCSCFLTSVVREQ